MIELKRARQDLHFIFAGQVVGVFERQREPRLVACVEPACKDFVLDEWGLSEPRCLPHYRVHMRDREEAEERDRQRLRARTGTHFCEECISVFTVTDDFKRLNESTCEYEYGCPTCGSALIEADPVELSSFSDEKTGAQKPYAQRPKDVILPHQSYRDDD